MTLSFRRASDVRNVRQLGDPGYGPSYESPLIDLLMRRPVRVSGATPRAVTSSLCTIQCSQPREQTECVPVDRRRLDSPADRRHADARSTGLRLADDRVVRSRGAASEPKHHLGPDTLHRRRVRAGDDRVWAIGVDYDQYLQVSDDLQPYILTSMIKRFDVVADDVIASQALGTFSSGQEHWDLSRDGVDDATSGGFVDSYVPTLEDIRQDIIDGVIVVPTVP